MRGIPAEHLLHLFRKFARSGLEKQRVRLFFVGGPETSRRGCEQQGKSYLTRRRRGEEGDGCGSLTGGAISVSVALAWFRSYSRASWKSQ